MWRYHPSAEGARARAGGRDRAPARRAALRLHPPGADNVRWGGRAEAVMDVGCYCLSALQLLAGELPSPVRGASKGAGVDARVAALLR